MLKQLWADGLSASQIASEIGGVTRNAVIGKIHRLELINTLSPEQREQRQRKSTGRPRRERTATRKKIKVKKPDGTVVLRLEPYKPVDVKPPDTQFLCTLDDLGPVAANDTNELKCRAPIGDPGTEGFRFCGTPGAFPYCAFHHRMFYQAGTAYDGRSRRRDHARQAVAA